MTEGIEVTLPDGQVFPSIRQAAKFVPYSESVLRRRVAQGIPLDAPRAMPKDNSRNDVLRTWKPKRIMSKDQRLIVIKTIVEGRKLR